MSQAHSNTQQEQDNHKFCVAPMMDWTDRHCRYFHRLLTRRALLYTEMVTADAIIHGDREHLLGFDACEMPLALQIGGSDPVKLARAAKIGEVFGYQEINLNIGCPSDRVQEGRFGACLMAEPQVVADCMTAMAEAVAIPVTVKCRIGIDDMDDQAGLDDFVARVRQSGVTTFIVHARKAWLEGLSPKENRDVPPLNYERVYTLKHEMPELDIIINGGIENLDDAVGHLDHVDGVMLGRAAYHTPYILAEVDQIFYGETAQPLKRHQAVLAMSDYIEDHITKGGRLNQITRHMLGLFHGQPGARCWRRILSEESCHEGADFAVVEKALGAVLNAVTV